MYMYILLPGGCCSVVTAATAFDMCVLQLHMGVGILYVCVSRHTPRCLHISSEILNTCLCVHIHTTSLGTRTLGGTTKYIQCTCYVHVHT